MNNQIIKSDEKDINTNNNNQIRINFGKEEIINMINNNYDYEEIKKIIEAKIDFFMLDNFNNGIIQLFDEKINDLLETQEKLSVENEIIKQKIFFLENYLNSLKK